MKISIITVNLNNKEGLERTIFSVTQQTVLPLEWIVVDGDSIDGSKEFIQANKRLFSKWISEKDKGIYEAMNKGIKCSTGDYLLFLNSGDTLCSDEMLEKLMKTNCTTDYLFGYNIQLLGKKKMLRKVPDVITFYYLYTFTLWHQSMLISRKVFEQYGLYDEQLKIVSDWKQYLLALCKHNCSYTIFREAISMNEDLGISSAQGQFDQLLYERQCVFDEYFPFFIADYALFHKLFKMTPTGFFKGLRRVVLNISFKLRNRFK